MRISDWSSDVCSSDLALMCLEVGEPPRPTRSRTTLPRAPTGKNQPSVLLPTGCHTTSQLPFGCTQPQAFVSESDTSRTRIHSQVQSIGWTPRLFRTSTVRTSSDGYSRIV